MLFLDYQDRRPIYEQIVEKFRMLILSGAVEPSSKMPSVRQLAVELSINPNTIQRAYMELEQQGLICPVKGKGSFVTDSSRIRQIGVEETLSELKKITEKGMALGVGEEEMIDVIPALLHVPDEILRRHPFVPPSAGVQDQQAQTE